MFSRFNYWSMPVAQSQDSLDDYYSKKLAEKSGFIPFEDACIPIDYAGYNESHNPLRTDIDDSNPKDRLGVKKPSLSLVPSTALFEEAMAMKEGANKYGAYNWRSTKVRATVYADAALRHLMAYMDGEDIDPESGLPHEAKVRACMAILIDARHQGTLIDDRYTSNKTGDLIRKYTEK